jgi:hypothetical protein
MRRSFVGIVLAAGLLLSLPSAARTVTLPQSSTDASDTTDQLQVSKQDEIVTFNTKTGKYHCVTCSAAKRCTRNCVNVKLSEAKERGGVACKICGGTCSASGSSGAESNRAQHIRCCDGTLSPSCTSVHSGCCSHRGGVCQ